MINWKDEFKNAHLTSWPTTGVGMGADIYRRDKKEIDRQAKAHGFSKTWETAARVEFIKGNFAGEPFRGGKSLSGAKKEDRRPYWVRKMVKDMTFLEKADFYLNPWRGAAPPYTPYRLLACVHNHVRFYLMDFIERRWGCYLWRFRLWRWKPL